MNSEQPFSLIRQVVEQGLSPSLWILVVLSVCSAALGAFFGSYLKKKGEAAALDEGFSAVLAQQVQLTEAVEGTKALIGREVARYSEELKLEIAKSLELFKAELQDKIKRQSDVITFRYTKIFGVIDEINKLPAISYTFIKWDGDKKVYDKDLLKQVVSAVSDRYVTIKRLFDTISSLVHDDLLVNVNKLFQEEDRQSSLMTKSIYTDTVLPPGVDVKTLLDVRIRTVEAIKTVLTDQLSRLTKIDEDTQRSLMSAVVR